jgi:uncharacterized protein (DUF3084 family)
MTVVILTITGAVVLIWGGVLAILKWITPVEKKHLLGFAGYVTVVSGLLIGLVLHTFTTQQEAAFATTRSRLDQELGKFQKQLGDLTGKLMGQMAEKAELTQSEWEVRGNLQAERAEHEQARKLLARVREELVQAGAVLTRRTSAYVDSLASERTDLLKTGQQLALKVNELQKTQKTLVQTRTERDRALEKLAAHDRDLQRLERELTEARRRADETARMLAELQGQLKQDSVVQEKSIYTLQAAIDSVYLKVMKRPRIPDPKTKN